MTLRTCTWVSLILLAHVAVAVGAAFYRYQLDPSFWGDEAMVAVNLIVPPDLGRLFAALKNGQQFPRLYLGLITILRSLFGYETQVLRALPLTFFVGASLGWVAYLATGLRSIRSRATQAALALLAGAMLVGNPGWLRYGYELKQYSWDVFWALVPFLISDRFYDETLGLGRSRSRLLLLSAPLTLSYVFCVALAARLLGWWVWRRRTGTLKLHRAAVAGFVVTSIVFLGLIYWFDLRYNLRTNITKYWGSCILPRRVEMQGFGGGMRLLGDYAFGWYEAAPLWILWTAVPLSVLGVISACRRAASARAIGSAFLILVVPVFSLVVGYPICSGRLVLFALPHFQLMILLGVAALTTYLSRRARSLALPVAALLAVVWWVNSMGEVRGFVTRHPGSDLRQVLPAMNSREAIEVYVHRNSRIQVRALPEGLPLPVASWGDPIGSPGFPTGRPIWFLWTRPGRRAGETVPEFRKHATRWDVRASGQNVGLALAEFPP